MPQERRTIGFVDVGEETVGTQKANQATCDTHTKQGKPTFPAMLFWLLFGEFRAQFAHDELIHLINFERLDQAITARLIQLIDSGAHKIMDYQNQNADLAGLARICKIISRCCA